MEKTKDFTKIVDRIAKETDVDLPSGFNYRYAPYTCWKCGKDILVFKWCNGRIDGEIEQPHEPAPRTIKERHTSTSNETYWANVCPYCENVQGDWFLSIEPDSPFFKLRDIDNNKESFEADMAGIAEYYFDQLVVVPIVEKVGESEVQVSQQKRLL